ncbi:hypothetical protein U1Q18_036395 [Sarracenia purpurea var. burkii]
MGDISWVQGDLGWLSHLFIPTFPEASAYLRGQIRSLFGGATVRPGPEQLNCVAGLRGQAEREAKQQLSSGKTKHDNEQLVDAQTSDAYNRGFSSLEITNWLHSPSKKKSKGGTASTQRHILKLGEKEPVLSKEKGNKSEDEQDLGNIEGKNEVGDCSVGAVASIPLVKDVSEDSEPDSSKQELGRLSRVALDEGVADIEESDSSEESESTEIYGVEVRCSPMKKNEVKFLASYWRGY